MAGFSVHSTPARWASRAGRYALPVRWPRPTPSHWSIRPVPSQFTPLSARPRALVLPLLPPSYRQDFVSQLSNRSRSCCSLGRDPGFHCLLREAKPPAAQTSDSRAQPLRSTQSHTPSPALQAVSLFPPAPAFRRFASCCSPRFGGSGLCQGDKTRKRGKNTKQCKYIGTISESTVD